jgi:hypothetical protein
MEKEKILEFLKKYDYKFHEEDQKIVVKLDFSQRVNLDFSEDDKMKITDKLIGYNFLTGLLSISLKNAVIYNSIMCFFALVILSLLNLKGMGNNLVIIFGFIMIQHFLFSLYYLIKLESFKIQLIRNH